MIKKIKAWGSKAAAGTAMAGALMFGGLQLAAPVAAQDPLPPNCVQCGNCHPSLGGQGSWGSPAGGFCLFCCVVP